MDLTSWPNYQDQIVIHVGKIAIYSQFSCSTTLNRYGNIGVRHKEDTFCLWLCANLASKLFFCEICNLTYLLHFKSFLVPFATTAGWWLEFFIVYLHFKSVVRVIFFISTKSIITAQKIFDSIARTHNEKVKCNCNWSEGGRVSFRSLLLNEFFSCW